MGNQKPTSVGNISLGSGSNSSRSRRERLQNIDHYDFEKFVAELWEDQGWKTRVSSSSNDLGVDVEAWKSGMVDQKLAIQAKRYSDSNKVGRPEIQQYHALKEQDRDVDAVVVVTTSDFTNPAIAWASQHNIKLIDGEGLLEIVDEQGRHDLLDQYAPSEVEEPSQDPVEEKSLSDKELDEITIGDIIEDKNARIVLLVLASIMVLSMIQDATAATALAMVTLVRYSSSSSSASSSPAR